MKAVWVKKYAEAIHAIWSSALNFDAMTGKAIGVIFR
jgi:hypothetical protein